MKGGVLFAKELLYYFTSTPGFREGDQNYLFYRNHYIIYAILGHKHPAIIPTITLLSKSGLYGYIFKIEIKNIAANVLYIMSLLNVKSNSGKVDGVLKPITSFIIKLAFIGEHNTRIRSSNKVYNGREQFIEEAKIQYDIYNKHYLIGQYYVPPILTHEPLFLNEVDRLLPGEKEYILSLLQSVGDIDLNRDLGNAMLSDIGLIAMSFEEGYDILFNRPDHKNVLLCKFVHLLLCLEGGYYHGDPHYANVMIDPTKIVPHVWYKNEHTGRDENTGRALLIDFGRAHSILPEDMNAIKTLVEQGRFIEIITEFIYKRGIPVEFQDFRGYNWLREFYAGDNEIIQQMINNYLSFKRINPEMHSMSVEEFQRRYYNPKINKMNEGGKRYTMKHVKQSKKRSKKRINRRKSKKKY